MMMMDGDDDDDAYTIQFDQFTICLNFCSPVAFKIYDMDKDGYISNGELFQVNKYNINWSNNIQYKTNRKAWLQI